MGENKYCTTLTFNNKMMYMYLGIADFDGTSKFSFKIGFLGIAKIGVGGGPSEGVGGGRAFCEAEAWRLCCTVVHDKTAGTSSRVPSPLDACYMQIPASESVLFFFSHRRDKSRWIWRINQERVLV